MKYLLLVLMVAHVTLFADVEMKAEKKEEPDISLPIEKPIRLIRPVHPIINTGIVYQDNHYNTNYTDNCQRYVEMLTEKDEEIRQLHEEIEKLQSKEQVKMSQSLKSSCDAELKKFDERKSTVKIKNSVTIKNTPSK